MTLPEHARVTKDELDRLAHSLRDLTTALTDRERAVVDAVLAAAGRWRVALVNVPFVSYRRPSIQLGLLKEIAAEHGFLAETLHLNLDFAAAIGADLYEALCDFGRCFVGDWLFARAAFGDAAPARTDEFLARFRVPVAQLLEETGASEAQLLRLRDIEVPAYLDEMAASIRWEDFQVVGFTSTFQQNVAAFALARRLKESWPKLITVFGGANFEGEMGIEWTRTNHVIDYAVIGEGDATFPELLRALEAGADPAQVPGVAVRRGDKVASPRPRPLYRELDRLPAPDYGEYFERAERLGLLASTSRRETQIPFESARGCWWGAKSQCTFCGLNGASMAFRAKSPKRVSRELRDATKRYRSWRFEAVDNILDMRLLRELLPELAADDAGYELFYEIKANLTRQHVRLLAEAGVHSIQPGIESLSTPVLKLMRKGITAAQNVNTLRWARYYGINVGWNLLYGFPGESAADYRQQDALIPHLRHLQPPGAVGRIWMERFSPIYSDREQFGARHVRPHSSYEYIHPAGVDLNRVAYFFDYEFPDSIRDEELATTRQLIDDWQQAWRESTAALTFRATEGFVQIEDRREPADPRTFTFRGPLTAILKAMCDRPKTMSRVLRDLGLDEQREQIEATVAQLCDHGLVMRDGDYYLLLALPANPGR